MDVGESEIAAGLAVGEFLVIEFRAVGRGLLHSECGLEAVDGRVELIAFDGGSPLEPVHFLKPFNFR